MSVRTALVLCGGLGTRLRAAVGEAQKTMVDVAGVPFLERVLDWAAAGGVTRFVLCAGYQAETVRARFERRPAPPEFIVVAEPAPLGTAGALALARAHAGPGPVFVMNGDSLCPLDLAAMAAAHEAGDAAATVAVVVPGARVDGGFVVVDPDGRVTAFEERRPGPGRVLNAGVYVLSAAALAGIPEGPSSLERDVLPRLVAQGVRAFRTEAPLWDIGTPERLAAVRAAVEG